LPNFRIFPSNCGNALQSLSRDANRVAVLDRNRSASMLMLKRPGPTNRYYGIRLTGRTVAKLPARKRSDK
jgi:hypothetical protein